jgi:hypothetical protein
MFSKYLLLGISRQAFAITIRLRLEESQTRGTSTHELHVLGCNRGHDYGVIISNSQDHYSPDSVVP